MRRVLVVALPVAALAVVLVVAMSSGAGAAPRRHATYVAAASVAWQRAHTAHAPTAVTPMGSTCFVGAVECSETPCVEFIRSGTTQVVRTPTDDCAASRTQPLAPNQLAGPAHAPTGAATFERALRSRLVSLDKLLARRARR